MKANAPKKFYYAPYGDIREDYPITDNDIEYIRTDTFIEKACEWLEEHMIGWNNDFVKDFRNYMKGE